MIFHYGDQFDGIYAVLEGAIQLGYSDAEGREAVVAIADPMTRVAAYRTTDWPVATPRIAASRVTLTTSSTTVATPGSGSPCARTWADTGTDSPTGGGEPHHRRCSPVMTSTPNNSPGATTTVLVRTSTDCTYRGRPSDAGRGRESPLRCPTVNP